MILNLKAKPLEMETGRHIVALHEDDARELGLFPGDRVKLTLPGGSMIAITNFTRVMIQRGEIGTFVDVTEKLNVRSGDTISVTPAPRPRSTEFIRKKIQGERLSGEEISAIVDDIVAGNLSLAEMASFITAQAVRDMTMEEIVALTRKMVETGERLELDVHPVLDIHSIGGVPGNKYALVTVPIVAAAGLTLPKTSSRAITSAAGTADVMEVLANVELSLGEIKRIVERVGAVLAWGGAVKLAPADDIVITVGRTLGLDPRCQMLASVMSKKLAVGAEYALIDIPVGSGAKVETTEEAHKLAHAFMDLGHRLGIEVETALTYGGQPVGYAVGPALEAREALVTLLGKGPRSLVEKSTSLAGILLECGGVAARGSGKQVAIDILDSGKAYKKMREIIEAQGGNPGIEPDEIQVGDKREVIVAPHAGYITAIHNSRITEIARATGAPRDKGAGVRIMLKKGHKVDKGEPLFEIYAEHEAKLSDALALAKRSPPIKIEGMLLEKISERPHVG